MSGMAGMMATAPWVRVSGRLLCVAATLWMAWVLAGMAWLISGHDSARLPAPAVTAVRRAAPAVDVSRLAALNLFGQPPLAAAKGEAANAPDTSLQLRLSGVFVNADPEQSSAIVGERNNPSAPAKVYRVNESLPGGATLVEVYDDRILIRRGEGATEVLRFEKTSLLGGDTTAASGRETGNAGVRDMLSNAVQAMATAPEEFVQQMGLKPGDNGYEVTAQTPESMRNAVGLQPGDHIVSINGRRLGNPRRDRNVLGELQNGSGRVKVEIQRGGQTVTLERKL